MLKKKEMENAFSPQNHLFKKKTMRLQSIYDF